MGPDSNPTWIKAMVWFLSVANTVNAVFATWFTYDYNVVCITSSRQIVCSRTSDLLIILSATRTNLAIKWPSSRPLGVSQA